MVDGNHTCDDFRRDAASTYTVTVPKNTAVHNEATTAFYNQPFLYLNQNMYKRDPSNFTVKKWWSLIFKTKNAGQTHTLFST